MPESRFATPFYMFLYLYGAAVAWSITSGLGRSAAGRHGVFSLTIVLLALATVWLVQERSRAFAARPTLPLRSVERSAQRFERYAAILSVESASLLAPDIGGPVFSGRLKIYDLAGLCDRVIARSLGNGSRQQSRQRFYDYVFEEAKPTFITMHTAWTRLAKLNHDSRFTRDYVAIASYPVDTSSEHEGVTLESGHFVRRDVLRGRSDLLDLIRQWERSPGRDEGRVREERRTAQ